jgi:hypothetical protein
MARKQMNRHDAKSAKGFLIFLLGGLGALAVSALTTTARR